MGKFRFRSYLDQALFVLVIMAGAAVSAVLDVRAVAGAMASGKLGVAAGVAAMPQASPSVAATQRSQPRPPDAAGSAVHSALDATIVARLAH